MGSRVLAASWQWLPHDLREVRGRQWLLKDVMASSKTIWDALRKENIFFDALKGLWDTIVRFGYAL